VGQPETPGRSDAPADIPGDWVVADGDPAELKVGDHVLAKPGERIPIDGVVLSGTTSVNQAPITGESLPVEKLPGDPVFAGTLNGEGSLIIRATRTADESTLAHIARLVREAQSSRSPTQRLVDRFAQHYTPAVIALAVLIAVVPPLLANVGVAWAASVSPWQWIHRGLVLLVIACPCALVLSTPVTIVCGVYAAARRGVLIKGGEHLEAAAEIECMAFDKTGTLTRGVPEVVHVDPVSGHSADEVLRIAAALEQHSEHPLAAAIVRAADERFLGRLPVEEFQALRGLGVEGTVNGVRCLVGNARLMQQRDISVRDGNAGGPLPAGRGDLAITKAVVAANGRQLGNVWLADRLRAGAAEAIGQLRQLGVSPIWMLTGDHPDVARPIGEQLGVDEVFGHLLPADKVKRVRELAESHPHLAMVGDGVNDAPALAEAFVGIALGAQSSDTALETADVVLMSPQPGRLPELIRLGRDCRRLLAQNIAFSLGIKGAVLCLAALGWATMWVAVASDVGASLIVIANGTRILRNGRRGLLPLCFAP
jgi:Cd2+/Zn2+-exporting ATPase